MPERDDRGQPYEVHGSGAIAVLLRRIQRQATREGRGGQVLAAIRQIYQRLHTDPMNFGEPAYRLPGLRMQVRTAAVRPLIVDFGVCEDRPMVFIKGIKLLSGR
jgi:hypothetical protein